MSDVTEVSPGDASVARTRWQQDARIAATYLGSALVGGIAGGLVVGGIGSRLAMLVLRLTSGDSVVGLISDDGFEIGRLSGDSFFLLLFGTALGAAVGILYMLTRPWLPAPWRYPVFAVLGTLVGGSGIVHADGIDFRLLEPVWLAVLMFVVLPAVGSFTIAVLVERSLERARKGERRPTWLVFLPLLGLVVIGPAGIGLAIVVPLGILINRKIPLVSLWTSTVVTWIGRVLLAGWGAAAAIALLNDLRGIFG
jgi:hypothetical protein